jgi:hypothetical protein
LCELQSDLVEYWVLFVRLWVDCSLSVSISIACAALLVDATHGLLATPDVSALRLFRNFLNHSVDVVLGLFDSLDSALFARALSFPLLLAHFALAFGLHLFCFFFCQFLIFVAYNFLIIKFYLCSSHFTKLRKFTRRYNSHRLSRSVTELRLILYSAGARMETPIALPPRSMT